MLKTALNRSALWTVIAALTLLLAPGTVWAESRKKVVAYVPNWVNLETFADTIDYAKITHINIAFENVTNDAGDLSFNRKNPVLMAKARTNGIPVLISIGGGSASGNKTLLNRYYSLMATTNRTAFATKLADYVVAHGFDGLDVDLEGPTINEDYGGFIAELGRALKPKGKLLTAALSKGYGGDKVPSSVFEHFDFVNIMAYDGAGYWSPDRPGQHSSMKFARDNVDFWLKRGLPKAKAILGVPFYGYGFGEAFRKRDYSYAAILAAYPGADQKDEVGSTIWYNGLPTIRAKSQYVVDESLGGIMIWSLDYDVPGERSLLTAIHNTLTGAAATPASATAK